MPRSVDPSSIQTGAGLSGSQTGTLTWDTFGVSPIIGHLGPDQPASYDPGQMALAAIKAHVKDIHNAHMAVAIGVEDANPNQYISTNLEGVSRELFAATLPTPPSIGMFARYTTFTGIPDWSYARLDDCSIRLRDAGAGGVDPINGTDNTNDASEVFPYFLVPPNPTTDPIFPVEGSDPSTDPYWNFPCVGSAFIGWWDGSHAAGYTNAADEVLMTRVQPGGAMWWPVTVSGAVFPADRGVLSILHIPSEGDTAAFLAQPLLKRCLAAILLGQGLEGDACIDPTDPSGDACDGEPGGIFDIGHNRAVIDDPYNPFAFPGRATGQYNLRELHTGVSALDGVPLNAPWNTPALRGYQGVFPAHGQVRIGTNPAIGTPQDWGIPILGANDIAYVEGGGHFLDTVPGVHPFAGDKVIGDSLVIDSNFFKYRLPCLADYSAQTGLKYTPRGLDHETTRETFRFFDPGTPDVDYKVPTGIPYQWETPTPVWQMSQAGNYADFDQDYWTWQIARFRHTFIASGSNALSDPVSDNELLGTYFLVHFKTEKDFENFVLSGTVPATVYGADVINAGINDSATAVNEQTTVTEWAPFGPAPAYGYSAPSYHATRRETALGGSAANHALTDANFVTSEFTIDQLQTFLNVVSGVAYFVPLFDDGTDAVTIDSLTVDVQAVGASDPWAGSYLTDDIPINGAPNALLSTPCPAFLSVAPFAYGTESGTPTFVAPIPLLSDSDKVRRGRLELPYTLLGTHGGNPFSPTNGPQAGDNLTVTLVALDPDMTFTGDLTNPGFSSDAAPRIFIRRPLSHEIWESSVQPPWTLAAFPTIEGHGQKLELDTGNKLLFHSTRFVSVPEEGKFGNFNDGTPKPYSCLMTQDKDAQERFLDEVYRYNKTLMGSMMTYGSHLRGPGMSGWGGGPIPVPVRPAATIDPAWKATLWMYREDFLHTLLGTDLGYASLASELQVAGLPDRNPPIQDWVKYPFPSAGLLKYPNIDYTAGYTPNGPEGWVQPDYSGASGYRYYLRAFDTAFSHTGPLAAVPSAGQPFVTLRLDGVQLEDIQYNVGDIAGINQAFPGVYVKVPGLTTWMHVGRADGAGPSKQDPLLDEAGCQVIGPYTFNGVDNDTGVVYCQIRVNVGPAVNLAVGEGDEVPILVRVIMPEYTTGDWDLTSTYDTGTRTFGAPTGPGIRSNTIRGLVGIRVLHTTQIETGD